MNRTRTFVLMVSLTILFVLVGGAMGGSQGAVTAFVFAAVMNLFAYWFSDKIILRRYAASEVGPEDQSRLYRIVAELAQMPVCPCRGSSLFLKKALTPLQPAAIPNMPLSLRQRAC